MDVGQEEWMMELRECIVRVEHGCSTISEHDR